MIFFSFFSLLAAYFIGGIIFLKFVKKSSGTEIIPNIDFWKGLPNDVKVNLISKLIFLKSSIKYLFF